VSDDLERRIDRKLDIGRGLSLSYEDLVLWVETGAYATFKEAMRQRRERKCLEHAGRSHSISGEISGSIRERGGTSKLSGTTANDDGSEALARAQRTLKPGRLPSTSSTSRPRAANTFPRSVG
jgi:hypothetical protein